VVVAFGGGCSEDPCEEVSLRLHACCDKGPAELRDACEASAAKLASDGNSEACDEALERDDLSECEL